MFGTTRTIKFKTTEDLNNEIQRIKQDYGSIKPDNVHVNFNFESIVFDDSIQELKVIVRVG